VTIDGSSALGAGIGGLGDFRITGTGDLKLITRTGADIGFSPGTIEVLDEASLTIDATSESEFGFGLFGSPDITVDTAGSVTLIGRGGSRGSYLESGVQLIVTNGTVTFDGVATSAFAQTGLTFGFPDVVISGENSAVYLNGTTPAGSGGSGAVELLLSAILITDGATLRIAGLDEGNGIGVYILAAPLLSAVDTEIMINGSSAGGTGLAGLGAIEGIEVGGKGKLALIGHSGGLDPFTGDIASGVDLATVNSMSVTGDGTLEVTGTSNEGVGVNVVGSGAQPVGSNVMVTDNGALVITGTSTDNIGVQLDFPEIVFDGREFRVTGHSNSSTGLDIRGIQSPLTLSVGKTVFHGESDEGAGLVGIPPNLTINLSGDAALELFGRSGGDNAGLALNGQLNVRDNGSASISGIAEDGVGVDLNFSNVDFNSTGALVMDGRSDSNTGLNLSGVGALLNLSAGTEVFHGESNQALGIFGIDTGIDINVGGGVDADNDGQIDPGSGANVTIYGRSGGPLAGLDLSGNLAVRQGGVLDLTGVSTSGPGASIAGPLNISGSGAANITGISTGAATGMNVTGTFTVSNQAHVSVTGTSFAGIGTLVTGTLDFSNTSTAEITGTSGVLFGVNLNGAVRIGEGATVNIIGCTASAGIPVSPQLGGVGLGLRDLDIDGGTVHVTGTATGDSNGIVFVSVPDDGVFTLTSGMVVLDGTAVTRAGIQGAGGATLAVNNSASISFIGASDTGVGVTLLSNLDISDTASMTVDGTSNAGDGVVLGGQVVVESGTLDVTGKAGAGLGVSLANASATYAMGGGTATFHGESRDGVGLGMNVAGVTVGGAASLALSGVSGGENAGVHLATFGAGLDVSNAGAVLDVTGSSDAGPGILYSAALDLSAGEVTLSGASRGGSGLTGMAANLEVTDAGVLSLIGASDAAVVGVDLSGGNANVAAGGRLNVMGSSNGAVGVLVGNVSTTGIGSRTEIMGLASNTTADGVRVVTAANSSAGGFVNISGHSEGGIGVNIPASANVASVGGQASLSGPRDGTTTNITGSTTSQDGRGVVVENGRSAYYFNGGFVQLTGVLTDTPPEPAFTPLVELAASFAAPPPPPEPPPPPPPNEEFLPPDPGDGGGSPPPDPDAGNGDPASDPGNGDGATSPEPGGPPEPDPGAGNGESPETPPGPGVDPAPSPEPPVPPEAVAPPPGASGPAGSGGGGGSGAVLAGIGAAALGGAVLAGSSGWGLDAPQQLSVQGATELWADAVLEGMEIDPDGKAAIVRLRTRSGSRELRLALEDAGDGVRHFAAVSPQDVGSGTPRHAELSFDPATRAWFFQETGTWHGQAYTVRARGWLTAAAKGALS
jgi:hypothetical protein